MTFKATMPTGGGTATIVAVFAGAVMWAGCSATQPPAAPIAPPTQTVRAAEALGARQHPRAALHLKLAQDQIARADALRRNGEPTRAAWALARARADADLALAIVREYGDRARAEAASARLRQILPAPPKVGPEQRTGSNP